MGKLINDGGNLSVFDGASKTWSTDRLTMATMPDNALIVTGQLIDFGDIPKDNILYWSRIGAAGVGGDEQTSGYISAVPGETTYTDIVLGTVPAACDFLRIRIKLTRTVSPTAPNTANMLTGPLDPIPPMGDFIMIHGGFLPLEQASPIARAISIFNDGGTVKLRRRQSVARDILNDDLFAEVGASWSVNNDPTGYATVVGSGALEPPGTVVCSGNYTYGGQKGEAIYWLGDSNTGPAGPTDYSHQRGGANQMSLADPTNFQSVYSADIVIEPGYNLVDPVIKAPTTKTALRAFYGYHINHSGETTATYSSVPIGTAPTGSGTRYVIVMVMGGNLTFSQAGDAASVTIGGVSAGAQVGPSSQYLGASIWILSVPAGTTADIVVNFSHPSFGNAILVYSVYNISGVVDFNSMGGDSETSNPSMTLHTAAGGFTFVCSAYMDVNPTNTVVFGPLLSGLAAPGSQAIVMWSGGGPFYFNPMNLEAAVQPTDGSDLTIGMAGDFYRHYVVGAISVS